MTLPSSALRASSMREDHAGSLRPRREGRTPQQKKALMTDITDAVLKHFNAPPEAVVVTIVESLKINEAKAGVPFSER